MLNGDLESSELENDEVLCLLGPDAAWSVQGPALGEGHTYRLPGRLAAGGEARPHRSPSAQREQLQEGPDQAPQSFRSETKEPVQAPEGRDDP